MLAVRRVYRSRVVEARSWPMARRTMFGGTVGVKATETTLAELLAADLSGLDLAALTVEGVHFGESSTLRRPGGTPRPTRAADPGPGATDHILAGGRVCWLPRSPASVQVCTRLPGGPT